MNEQIKKSISNRGLNDYTADKVSYNKETTKPWWKEPRKSAFHISSYSPGMKLDLKHPYQKNI